MVGVTGRLARLARAEHGCKQLHGRRLSPDADLCSSGTDQAMCICGPRRWAEKPRSRSPVIHMDKLRGLQPRRQAHCSRQLGPHRSAVDAASRQACGPAAGTIPGRFRQPSLVPIARVSWTGWTDGMGAPVDVATGNVVGKRCRTMAWVLEPSCQRRCRTNRPGRTPEQETRWRVCGCGHGRAPAVSSPTQMGFKKWR